MFKSEKYIQLGTCKKVFGIKGAFSFYLFNNDTSLEKGSQVLLRPLPGSSLPESGKEMMIQSIKLGNKIVVELSGVEDRNLAEELLPFEIYLDKEDLPKLEEGEYYFNDLLGLTVKNKETQTEVGVVHSFSDNGVQDILVVRKKTGELLELPMVEPFLHQVDLADKIVWITLPDYI